MNLRSIHLLITFGLLPALSAQGPPPPPSERVHFKTGTSSATLTGAIDGQVDTRDYLIGAKAGQTLKVDLKASSKSVYYNVLPPKSEEALVNTSITGESSWSGKLAATGDYTVRVYLMRSASRRGVKATYTLKLEIPPA